MASSGTSSASSPAWWRAGNEARTLGAQPDARRVDDQGAAGQACRRVEHEDVALLRAHRQGQAERCGQRRTPGAGRNQHGVAGMRLAARIAHRVHAVAGRIERQRVGVHEACTAGPCFAAEGRVQGRAVEPAFAAHAMRGQDQTVGREPGPPRTQGRRIEQLDLGAVRALQGMVGAQLRRPCRAGQVQVAGLDQADRGSLAIDGEFVTDAAQEVDAGLRSAMLIGVENCCRIELADSALEAWR